MLEIGSGSGYGAAVAREVVGPNGLVVTIEIDPVTQEFAKSNLMRLGYRDVVAVQGDGGLGYPGRAPYDRICFTAACREVPAPLIEQLAVGGKLIGPVLEEGIQYLTLCTKEDREVVRQRICPVLYVSLRGRYGEQA